MKHCASRIVEDLCCCTFSSEQWFINCVLKTSNWVWNWRIIAVSSAAGSVLLASALSCTLLTWLAHMISCYRLTTQYLRKQILNLPFFPSWKWEVMAWMTPKLSSLHAPLVKISSSRCSSMQFILTLIHSIAREQIKKKYLMLSYRVTYTLAKE